MSEGKRTIIRQLIEIGDTHYSGDSSSDEEENLRSQFLDRRMTLTYPDRTINAIVALLCSQIEALIQPVRKIDEKNCICATEGNTTSEQWRSSGQRSDNHLMFSADFMFLLWKLSGLF